MKQSAFLEILLDMQLETSPSPHWISAKYVRTYEMGSGRFPYRSLPCLCSLSGVNISPLLEMEQKFMKFETWHSCRSITTSTFKSGCQMVPLQGVSSPIFLKGLISTPTGRCWYIEYCCFLLCNPSILSLISRKSSIGFGTMGLSYITQAIITRCTQPGSSLVWGQRFEPV